MSADGLRRDKEITFHDDEGIRWTVARSDVCEKECADSEKM